MPGVQVNMGRATTIFALCIITLSFVSFQTAYAYNLTDCSIINVSGTYYLTQNITSSPAQRCFYITAKNVILDCMGNAISGTDAGDSSGIFASNDNINITNCVMADWYIAIRKEGSNYGAIQNVSLSSNTKGIAITSSEGNRVLNSKIYENAQGASISFSENNLFYNNLFKNTNNIVFTGLNKNSWNTSRQISDRIHGKGSYIGGNYWSTPVNSGYSNGCLDLNSDGFCDAPYAMDSSNTDYLPLSGGYIADTTPPSVKINSPTSNSITNSTNLTISLEADDAVYRYTNISIYQGNVTIKSVLSYQKGNFSVSIKVERGGYYNISATAYDYDNNSNTANATNILTPLELAGCDDLSVSGEKYVLEKNIAYSGGSICLNILADNILLDCQGRSILGSDTTYKTYGISMNGRKNVKITNCMISGWNYGIFSQSSSNNEISQCVITKNKDSGIYFYLSSANQIHDNAIGNNTGYGIDIYSSADNVIYNNVFDNKFNIFFEGDIQKNSWNVKKMAGKRIATPGRELAGNFWAGANEYSKSCIDSNIDGFCDEPYDVELLTYNPPTGAFITKVTGLFYGIATLLFKSTSNNIDNLPLSDNYLPDLTAPATNVTVRLPDGSILNTSEWARSAYVTVSFKCLDTNGSGCKFTRYCFDIDANCTPYKNYDYNTSFNITFDKNLTRVIYLDYYSADMELNNETMKNLTIQCLSTSTKEIIDSPKNLAYRNSTNLNVFVTVLKNDEHNYTEVTIYNSTSSAVSAKNFSSNGTFNSTLTVPREGTYTIVTTFHSIYGFATNESQATVYVDLTPPQVSLILDKSRVYVDETITPACTAVDNMKTGVIPVQIGSIDTRTAGKMTVECTAVDDAGNTGSNKTTYEVLDKACEKGRKRCNNDKVESCDGSAWVIEDPCEGMVCDYDTAGNPRCIANSEDPGENPEDTAPGEGNTTGGETTEGISPTIVAVGALVILIIIVAMVILYMKMFRKPAGNSIVKKLALIEAKISEAEAKGKDVSAIRSEFEMAQQDINMGLLEMAGPRIKSIENNLKKLG